MNILLKLNIAFKWYKNDTLNFKGYFYVDNQFYEKEAALNFLSCVKTESNFKEVIKKINGVFYNCFF